MQVNLKKTLNSSLAPLLWSELKNSCQQGLKGKWLTNNPSPNYMTQDTFIDELFIYLKARVKQRENLASTSLLPKRLQ